MDHISNNYIFILTLQLEKLALKIIGKIREAWTIFLKLNLHNFFLSVSRISIPICLNNCQHQAQDRKNKSLKRNICQHIWKDQTQIFTIGNSTFIMARVLPIDYGDQICKCFIYRHIIKACPLACLI